MADKLTPLIVAALTRAAAEPAGVAIVAVRGEIGLFPNTTLAKTAARRCLDDSLLRPAERSDPQATVERCTITPKGLAYLAEHQNPKAVLEDLVRVLEERRGQVEELLTSARSMAENLNGLQAMLEAVVPKVTGARVPVESDLAAAIQGLLRDWTQAEDCPLPELHRRLPSRPSLGAFHDALRQLHRAGRIYLHPWTGPLYTLPDPSLALLVGHEVAYYASAQSRLLPSPPWGEGLGVGGGPLVDLQRNQ